MCVHVWILVQHAYLNLSKQQCLISKKKLIPMPLCPLPLHWPAWARCGDRGAGCTGRCSWRSDRDWIWPCCFCIVLVSSLIRTSCCSSRSSRLAFSAWAITREHRGNATYVFHFSFFLAKISIFVQQSFHNFFAKFFDQASLDDVEDINKFDEQTAKYLTHGQKPNIGLSIEEEEEGHDYVWSKIEIRKRVKNVRVSIQLDMILCIEMFIFSKLRLFFRNT